MKNKALLFITQTALTIALLTGWQIITKPLSPMITGTGVNFILILATVVCSCQTGLCTATIAPVTAALFGFPPFWIIVPFIMLGNVVLVLVWSSLRDIAGNNTRVRAITSGIIVIIFAALTKFGVLYAGVNFVAASLSKTALPPPVLAAFSFPQLFTASLGGTLAFMTVPIVNKALSNRN
ncbi:MAG: hypothetical protein FWF82_07135 [Oscillospiraceae bacterium]|nr:hypothetical protein [Oscillospiraceae bacterium]